MKSVFRFFDCDDHFWNVIKRLGAVSTVAYGARLMGWVLPRRVFRIGPTKWKPIMLCFPGPIKSPFTFAFEAQLSIVTKEKERHNPKKKKSVNYQSSKWVTPSLLEVRSLRLESYYHAFQKRKLKQWFSLKWVNNIQNINIVICINNLICVLRLKSYYFV